MKELPSQMRNKAGQTLVEVSLDIAFNCKASERPLVEDFFFAMVDRKVMSSGDVFKGTLPTCEFLQDLKIDMPLCDLWLGRLFGKMLGAGIDGAIFEDIFRLVKQIGGLRPEVLGWYTIGYCASN